MKVCQVCQVCQGELIRAHRRRFTEFLFSLAGIYPFACKSCGTRTFGSQKKEVAAVGLLLLVTMAATTYCATRIYANLGAKLRGVQAASFQVPAIPEFKSTPIPSRVLHNEDILELSRAKVSSPTIIDLMHKVGHDFQVDTPSLVALKNAGIAEDVMLAMVDVTLKKPDAPFNPRLSRP